MLFIPFFIPLQRRRLGAPAPRGQHPIDGQQRGLSTLKPWPEPHHHHLLALLPGILEGHSLCQQEDAKLGRHLPISLCRLGSSAGQPSPETRDCQHPSSLHPLPLHPSSSHPSPCRSSAPSSAGRDSEIQREILSCTNPDPKLFSHTAAAGPAGPRADPAALAVFARSHAMGQGWDRRFPSGMGFSQKAGMGLAGSWGQTGQRLQPRRASQGTSREQIPQAAAPHALQLCFQFHHGAKTTLGKAQPKATGFHQDEGQ